MIAVLHRLYKSQRAATLIEYSLIVCLIAGVAIGAMSNMGQKVPVSYTHLTLPTIYSV